LFFDNDGDGDGYTQEDDVVEELEEKIPSNLLMASESPVEDDSEMAEAESRLHKANLYRQFLVGRVFAGHDDDTDSITLEVEKEFRDFAKTRLSILLGISSAKPEAAQQQFSADEVEVLRLVAKRMKVATSTTAPSVPPKNIAPRKMAELKPRQLTQTQTKSAISKPAMKPAIKPAISKPAMDASNKAPPVTASPVDKKRKTVPQDEEIIEERGRKYKVAWREVNFDSLDRNSREHLSQMKNDSASVLPDGVQVVKTSGGDFFKIVKCDLTTQKRNSASVPMPMGHQFDVISAMRAAEAVSTVSNYTNTIITKLGTKT